MGFGRMIITQSAQPEGCGYKSLQASPQSEDCGYNYNHHYNFSFVFMLVL
jgi:hypothetical protein